MIRKDKVPNGVNKETSNDSRGHEGGQPIREYSHSAELINNLPYLAMLVLGTAVLVMGFGGSVLGWLGGSAYLIYGVAGSLWIIVFVCPYCRYWDTRACPCGYGRIAAKLRGRKAACPPYHPSDVFSPALDTLGRRADRFNEKFKKHIPVIVPLWLFPVFTGAVLVIHSFSWMLLVLLVVFVLDAFVVLPLLSVKHGCRGCPQKSTCPWMGRETSFKF